MSNECKDWVIENNKQLCSKFPFLKLDDEYNYTWLARANLLFKPVVSYS